MFSITNFPRNNKRLSYNNDVYCKTTCARLKLLFVGFSIIIRTIFLPALGIISSVILFFFLKKPSNLCHMNQPPYFICILQTNHFIYKNIQVIYPFLEYYLACILLNNASCNTFEKLIPFSIAISLSHAGIVNVFFTALVSLY